MSPSRAKRRTTIRAASKIRTLRLWKAVALALLCGVCAADAQTTADWAEIEAVEVNARPGPAVWHLTRGNSEVWILGTVGAMPKALDWNKDYLADLLDGPRAILMPPKANIGIVDIGWFLLMHGSELSLPRGQTLEQSLPDALRARFIAARDATGGDASDYRTDTPIRAAIRLQQDFMKKADPLLQRTARPDRGHGGAQAYPQCAGDPLRGDGRHSRDAQADAGAAAGFAWARPPAM